MHRWLFALFSFLVVACGGSAEGSKGPVLPVPPPASLLDLTFLFVPARGNEKWAASTNDAVEGALIKAGYKITKEERDPHDATIVLDLAATEKQSFITVQMNGEKVVDYSVRAILTVKDKSGVVTAETHELVSEGGRTTADQGLEAVNDLSGAIRLRVWAMKLVAAHAEGAPSGSASAGPVGSAAPSEAP